ncbi:MAG: arylesterase [Acidobacteria bacterium]|nr:arylesterase [Acidobacteriota bacterium]
MTKQQWQIAAAAAVAVVLVWMLWPSGLSRVKNLDSPNRNIIAFGDSLTYGYGAQPGEDWPSRLSAALGKPIVNAGVNGDTTTSALARLDADVLSQDPRIVIVGLGGNDFLSNTSPATTEANLREIVRRIQAARGIVVLLSFKFPSFNADYDAMYTRIAKSERCYLIPGILSGILTDQSLKSDEIHPNAKGYALMASRMEKPMRKLLGRAEEER